MHATYSHTENTYIYKNGWQWQIICNLFQTDNHTSISPLYSL